MAIKISGNTIIDDSRNLTANTITATTFTGNAASVTVPDFLQVLAPTNISPTDSATDVSVTPTLQVSGFQSTAGSTHANTQFQISTASDFSSTVVDTFTGANTTLSVNNQISFDTEHFFRARFIDNNGCCSNFSNPTCFTTLPASAEFEGASIGDSAGGGFYIGSICAASSCYYLVLAPNSGGCGACCVFPFFNDFNSRCTCDGYHNSYTEGGFNGFPINFARGLNLNSYTDWYLPAICELTEVYSNKNAPPAGEGFSAGHYWSSTDSNCGGYISESRMRALRFDNGALAGCNKKCTLSMRAIRRVAFPT